MAPRTDLLRVQQRRISISATACHCGVHVNAGEVNAVPCLGAFLLSDTDIGCPWLQRKLFLPRMAQQCLLPALSFCSNVCFQVTSLASVNWFLTCQDAVLTLISGSHQGELLRVLPDLSLAPLGCWNLLPSR